MDRSGFEPEFFPKPRGHDTGFRHRPNRIEKKYNSLKTLLIDKI